MHHGPGSDYRFGYRLDDNDSRHADAIEHLTAAAGELSQGQRGLALDVQAIGTTLVDRGARLDRIESM